MQKNIFVVVSSSFLVCQIYNNILQKNPKKNTITTTAKKMIFLKKKPVEHEKAFKTKPKNIRNQRIAAFRWIFAILGL